MKKYPRRLEGLVAPRTVAVRRTVAAQRTVAARRTVAVLLKRIIQTLLLSEPLSRYSTPPIWLTHASQPCLMIFTHALLRNQGHDFRSHLGVPISLQEPCAPLTLSNDRIRVYGPQLENTLPAWEACRIVYITLFR